MTNGKRNRQWGHDFERDIAKKYRAIGFKNAATSRYVSRELDDRKIDIAGVSKLAPQLKATNNTINYVQIMNEIKAKKTDIKLIHNKVYRKRNGKVISGRYVILEEDDWFELLHSMVMEGIINTEPYVED